MNSIDQPFSEVPWSEIPVVDTNAPRWLSILKGNVMGIMLFGMMKRDFTDPFNGAYSEDVSCTATQLLLALKIYKSRHGALPDSLSSLVPEFFPAVPTDAFDGKPFRYSPQEQIIYSVGPDLKDSGGAERNQDPKSDDISFKIGF